jgi:crotonobetainyl-CoA:carnitine CoA-transferase CaiB-like acyl-CoA transferase
MGQGEAGVGAGAVGEEADRPGSTSGPLPLEGIVVVDESEGPMAGLTTLVLADFGARVIKLERPGGDPWRAQAGAALWLRGKRSLVVADGDRSRLESLARAADLWVRGPAECPAGLDDAALAALNPRLVIGWVSAFGRTGPYAGYPASEALVAAKVGRMLQFRGAVSRPGPVYSALQVATHAASQALLAALLAALRARDRDGVGQVVETSLARGLLAYEMNNVLATQVNARLRGRGETELPAPPDPMTVMPTLNYHPVRAADGRWLQLGNLLPHLFRSFVEAIGLAAEMDALGVSGPTEQWPEAEREALRSLILARLQERDADAWQRLFVADGGVASHPYQSTQEALADPDLVANGHVVPFGEGGCQLGLIARLTRTPGRVGERVPAVGEDEAEVLAWLAGRAAAVAAQAPAVRRPPPLAGVTVVEAATIIAAPFGAAMLADMGARVIKFEPLDGDPFRGMPPGLGAARVNTGKQSIALDLKRPQARAIAHRLIAGADLFIHNYRPGVPERLGLDWATLSAINPRLVHLSANGYGPAGPGALRPSTHPIPGAALGGVLWQVGGAPDAGPMDEATVRETARRLMRANEVNPDPNTSLVIASAAMLGLAARDRLGVGQAIFVDMFGANAWANFDDAIAWPGKPPRPMPDRDGYGLHPLWRLYPCAQGWVFLAIDGAQAWEGLRAQLSAEFAVEPALARDYPAACAGGAAVSDALARVFAGAPAAQWEARLASRGVGCVQADAATPDGFFLNDPQAIDQGLCLAAEHPQWGAYRRHGALAVFDGTPGVYLGTAALGGSTGALLAELGLPAGERAALREAGVVG